MAKVTLADLSLKEYALSESVARLRDSYFRAMPEICIERPRLVTKYHQLHSLLEKDRITILDKARAYEFVLKNRTPIVWHQKSFEKGMVPFEFEDTSPFAGSTTSKFKGVPLYPEFMALALWPELWTINERKSNPYHITDTEVDILNQEIFPHWIDNTILELARESCYKKNLKEYGILNHDPEFKLLSRLVFFLASKPNCISHTIPDFSKALKVGLRGIIDEANERGEKAADASQKRFYAAISDVLEGVIVFSRNLANQAERLADKENDISKKRELVEIAEINRRVPEYPARTFREGLTTIWICWIAIHLENPNVGLSLGRLDQVLYGLYSQDIEDGTIDIRKAIDLICYLWLKIGDHVPSIPEAGEQLFGGTGSNQAITIGGVDTKGEDAVNDLTYVMLRATELMKLRDPNLNGRYHSGVNSRDYLKQLCRVNLETGATPALHNDRAVIKAMTQRGETIEQARDYGIAGCVEPGSNGRFYGHTAAILLNLTSVLELALFNGRHRHTGQDVVITKETGDPTMFASFKEFQDAFEEQALWMVEHTTTLNNMLGKIHQDFYPTPILSALFDGPMEKGKDLIEGGAAINSSGIAVIGLADVADSLSAIERVVFEEKIITFKELLDALDNNFFGYEPLQKRLVNPEKTPKYGNEDPVADRNVAWIVELLDRAYGEKENYRGGKYRVGYWTMTNHAGFGRLMKALPNGRKEQENFTSGITPVSGVTPDLNKALNSVANLPVKCLSNGIALNLKFTPDDGDREKMLDEFVASVEAYFDDLKDKRDGGMEIQFNVTDRKEFARAIEDPAEHEELLVRVSGYTAYFKDLNPQMQREIIDRTEYRLSTKKMIEYAPFPLPTRRP